ncbi:MAG: hypothetical protein AB8H86_33350 [Polyangiales bacterium]
MRSFVGTEPPGAKDDEGVRAFVLAALDSRLSGHESLAARVLASWGRPEDKEHIKRWFTARMLHREDVGFRPDLLEVFAGFTGEAGVAFLMHMFRENSSLRTTVGHLLRDVPDAFAVARKLIEDGDPQQAADAISNLMWSRKRYGRALRVLEKDPHERVSAAASARLKLFHRFPNEYA